MVNLNIRQKKSPNRFFAYFSASLGQKNQIYTASFGMSRMKTTPLFY